MFFFSLNSTLTSTCSDNTIKTDNNLFHLVKLRVGFSGADGPHSKKGTMKSQHRQFKSNRMKIPPVTDLDTSEDLSVELERSHGFFTPSNKTQ